MKKSFKMISPLFLIILIAQSIISICQANIPSKYISDQAFINMMTKTTTPIKTIYASPKGSGSTCSKSSPCSLQKAVNSLTRGFTLYLKGGKYDVGSGIELTKSGTANLYIRISSAPNERAIITSSKKETVALFEVSASYLIIENITFKDVTVKNVQGIVFYEGGQNHVIIRNNLFDSLKTTKVSEDYGANGILLMGESKQGIKKVIIYKNTLTNNVLGYSEAISVAGNCEEIYVLNNILKDNTNIGIDFYGNAGYCKTPELDQPRKSVAMYNNIEKSVSKYASCAGLYIDGAKDIYVAENTIKKSQYGIEIGSEEKKDKYPVHDIIVVNNVMADNTETGLRIGGYEKDKTGIVKNCQIKKNTISGSHTAVIISKAQDITFDGNTFTDGDKYFIEMEFSSTYTKNINIVNNIFSGNGKFKLYGTTKLDLNEFIKKYPSNKKK